MLDQKGRIIHLGDRLRIAPGLEGVVVFSLDTGEFPPEFPKADWAYLGHGIMVRTEQAGLVHLSEPVEGVEILD
jgi:hypothetical protein